MSQFHVRIVTPEGLYKEFDTPYINLQTEDGDRGVLPNHMPLVTMLKIGHMSAEEAGKREIYAVAGGLFYFRDNLAEILTDAIESQDEIDEERAEDARKRAEERLSSSDPDIDIRRAEIALHKALNRLKTKAM